MNSFLKLISLAILSVGLTGCGTTMARIATKDDLGDSLYPATKLDFMMIGGCLNPDGTVFTEKSYLMAGLTLLDTPISLATDTVFLPFDLIRANRFKTRQKGREESKRRMELRLAEIRCNPELVFDQSLHLSKDHSDYILVRQSLNDGQTPFNTTHLRRIIEESPRFVDYVFNHPSCSEEFLVEHFESAKIRAKGTTYLMLASIVSHPNTPTPLVEEVANNPGFPGGAAGPARKELNRRLKKSSNKEGQLTP